jgi:hypothetical protein
MILVWFIAWWWESFPAVHPWNDWFVALILAIILA